MRLRKANSVCALMRSLAFLVALAAIAGCARSADTDSGTAATFDQLAKDSLARIDGRISVRGLNAEVEVLRDAWACRTFMRRTPTICFLRKARRRSGPSLADGDLAAHG